MSRNSKNGLRRHEFSSRSCAQKRRQFQHAQALRRKRSGFEKFEWMKTLAELIRLFERLGASDKAICEPCTHNGQLQLKASDLGHCAVYEKELQRVWPITEENRKAKIAEFGEKHGFRLAYYKQGHCAIFLNDSPGPRHQNSPAPSRGLASPTNSAFRSCLSEPIGSNLESNLGESPIPAPQTQSLSHPRAQPNAFRRGERQAIQIVCPSQSTAGT